MFCIAWVRVLRLGRDALSRCGFQDKLAIRRRPTHWAIPAGQNVPRLPRSYTTGQCISIKGLALPMIIIDNDCLQHMKASNRHIVSIPQFPEFAPLGIRVAMTIMSFPFLTS